VLDVAAGQALDPGVDPNADALLGEDVCIEPTVRVASAVAVQRAAAVLASVLNATPEPYRDDVPLPHFRNEFGGFVRAAGATRVGGALAGVVGPSPNTGVPRLQTALQVGLGVGLGAEGLTTRSTDGVFYVQADFAAYGADAYARGSCADPCRGALTRLGWGLRAHLPFWLVPGDTVAALVLLPFLPGPYTSMVLTAAQGSVWWRVERVRSGPYLSWQVVAGREAALYRSSSALPGQPFEMTELELPFAEVRTNHLFSNRLGEDASVQIGMTLQWTSLDTPHETLAPSVFARIAFDGIIYVVP
jgi:hypothetical protein